MFNRPFDDQSNIKILLETEAKLKIQERIRLGTYELVWSYILDYENSKNPFRERLKQIEKWRRYASINMDAEEGVVDLAKSFHQLGLKQFDALHLACAVKSDADYFLTTDGGILKKAGVVDNIRMKDPIDFIREIFP
ncbi:MAG: hypothetical protein H7832_09085 [Magnetococcus sp. DMHC-6]